MSVQMLQTVTVITQTPMSATLQADSLVNKAKRAVGLGTEKASDAADTVTGKASDAADTVKQSVCFQQCILPGQAHDLDDFMRCKRTTNDPFERMLILWYPLRSLSSHFKRVRLMVTAVLAKAARQLPRALHPALLAAAHSLLV